MTRFKNRKRNVVAVGDVHDWGDAMSSRIRTVLRSALRLVWWGLVLPWIALALLHIVLRRAEATFCLPLAYRTLFDHHGCCPRGHRTELRGVWECRGCGGLFAGIAFQACPVCGSGCGHIPCDEPGCGLAIRNPMV